MSIGSKKKKRMARLTSTPDLQNMSELFKSNNEIVSAINSVEQQTNNNQLK